VLEWTNHLLYCRNPACDTKAKKKVQHFVKSLKIKGLGPVAISKLGLSSISEIYVLTQVEIATALSSERLAEKLFYEIENSKNATLNSLLPAFSIPLVGKSAAEKLSIVCEHIYDIRDETCRRAGLGPKATENLLDWKRTELPQLENLPFSFKFKQPVIVSQDKGVVCITGKVGSGFKNKAEAHAYLIALGYGVKATLTKDVTILVNESGIESAKTKRARQTGVTIVTNLKDYFGE
jgi:NAD-dependent DNA ligase